MKIFFISPGRLSEKTGKLNRHGVRDVRRIANYMQLHPSSMKFARIYHGFGEDLKDTLKEFGKHYEVPLEADSSWSSNSIILEDGIKRIHARHRDSEENVVVITSSENISRISDIVKKRKTDFEVPLSSVQIVQDVGDRLAFESKKHDDYKTYYKLLMQDIREDRTAQAIIALFMVSMFVWFFTFAVIPVILIMISPALAIVALMLAVDRLFL